MSVATSTAIAIGLGAAGAASSVYGAKKASDASKDAARIQVGSADKAQQFNERVYGDQKQLMAPYIQGGQESFARLMQQHWGTPLPAGAAPSAGNSTVLAQQAGMALPRPPQGSQMPQGGQPMTLGAMQSQAGGGPSQGQSMPGAPPQEPMVLMESPDGERRPVPQSKVALAEQRGAKRVA